MASSTLPTALDPVPLTELPQAMRSGRYDAVLVVGPAPLSQAQLPSPLGEAIALAEKADVALTQDRAVVSCVPGKDVAGGRLVVSTTGNASSWEVDVRVMATAAANAITRALSSGAKRPLLVLVPPEGDERFERAIEAALLGALSAGWEPLENRRGLERAPRVEALGVVLKDAEGAAPRIDRVLSLERGRIVARDICGTEPEGMAPEGMARYCLDAFEGSPVKVEVVRDAAAIHDGYPLIAAVARASMWVERHHPRIIRLEYQGEGPIERTIFFAGKGLTYDTGGADLKTDGHMAGMSRDKGGAAAAAGVMRVVAERRPKNVRVVALLGAVRNSVGADSYVTDEVIRSRAGVRVRIGNTDAEGRLVLANLVAALREEAADAPSPTIFSIATLTGHAALAHGPYTAVLENGVARRRRVGDLLERAGDALGDPIERSRLRPEDYAFVAGKSSAEDVLSCNSLPSSRTPRGHQFPAAFVDIVSGLRAHNQRHDALAFLHVDIAGSAVANGSWQTGTPTGAPVIALAEGLGLLG